MKIYKHTYIYICNICCWWVLISQVLELCKKTQKECLKDFYLIVGLLYFVDLKKFRYRAFPLYISPLAKTTFPQQSCSASPLPSKQATFPSLSIITSSDQQAWCPKCFSRLSSLGSSRMDACGVRNLDSWAGCAQVIWTLSSLIFKNTWLVFYFSYLLCILRLLCFFNDCASRGRSTLMWHLPQKPSPPPPHPQPLGPCILWWCFLATGYDTSGFIPRSPLGQTQHSLFFTACKREGGMFTAQGHYATEYGSPGRMWSQNQACMQYAPL